VNQLSIADAVQCTHTVATGKPLTGGHRQPSVRIETVFIAKISMPHKNNGRLRNQNKVGGRLDLAVGLPFSISLRNQ